VLAGCPVGWNLSAVDSMKFIADTMVPYFPLGLFKDEGVTI